MLAIYGAEPKDKLSSGLIDSFVRKIKYARAFRRDAAGFLAGSLTSLDYRNYLSPSTINQGDIAIASSVSHLMLEHSPEATSTEMIRWGEADQYDPYWSDFVIAGSGYITFDNDGKLSSRLIKDIDFFRRHGTRPILFGIGVNQPKASTPDSSYITIDQEAKVELRELLSMAKAISVRDEFTRATLSQYTDKRVELTGDPALHFGRLHGIQPITSPRSQSQTLQVGLTLNFHGPSSTKLLQRNLPILAHALQLIRDEWQCEFRYFSHFDTDLVIPKLLALEGVKLEVVQGNPEIITRGYAEIDLHLGGMLHSCILAHSVDTPSIALAYDIKHRGFMELFGLERNCLSAAELTVPVLIERVRDVLSNPAPYKDIISATRERLEQVTHNFVKSSLSAA